jgi:hypothetical protein
MSRMATLYVRNIPAELYAELQRWAGDSGRSVNAEVIDLLGRETARRRQRSDWWSKFEEMRARFEPVEGPPWPEDIIRGFRGPIG